MSQHQDIYNRKKEKKSKRKIGERTLMKSYNHKNRYTLFSISFMNIFLCDY